MSVTLAQLLTETSEPVLRSFIFEAAGLDPATTVKTSIRGSVIWGAARLAFLGQSAVIKLATGGLLGLSRGLWLDLLGDRYYQDPRQPAQPAIRNATLSLPVGASPVTVAIGTRFQEKISGREWYVSNASPGVIAAATSQARILTAATPGEIGNVTPATAMVGNVPALLIAFTNAAATQTGNDRESDDRYTRRLFLRWSLNSYAVGPRAYERIALDAAPLVSSARVRINFPTFANIRIALRRANGPALPEDVTLVNVRALQIAAVNDIPLSEIAPTNSIPILVRPRIQRGTSTAADCTAAIVAALNRMPIGGIKKDGDTGYLLVEYIAQALSCKLPGVTSAGVITPAADVPLGANEIVGTVSITVEPTFYDWIV